MPSCDVNAHKTTLLWNEVSKTFSPTLAFAHLKNLRRLVLNSNRIATIKPFAFKVVPNYFAFTYGKKDFEDKKLILTLRPKN